MRILLLFVVISFVSAVGMFLFLSVDRIIVDVAVMSPAYPCNDTVSMRAPGAESGDTLLLREYLHSGQIEYAGPSSVIPLDSCTGDIGKALTFCYRLGVVL